MQDNVKLDKLINDRLEFLSTQERKVAEFILQHPEDLLKMSVQEASESAGVSQATVVRFCKSMGFQGMKEMKIAMGGVYSTPQEHTTPLSWDDEANAVKEKALYQASASIENVFSINSVETLTKISSIIAKATSIDIIGIGGSAIVGDYAKTQFMRLGKRTELFSANFPIPQLLMSASEDIPTLVISCSGETPSVIEAARAQKAKGSHLMVITGEKDSTLAQEADSLIITPRNEIFLDDKDAFSRISQFSLITTLYLMTAIEMGKNDESFRNNYLESTNYRQLSK